MHCFSVLEVQGLQLSFTQPTRFVLRAVLQIQDGKIFGLRMFTYVPPVSSFYLFRRYFAILMSSKSPLVYTTMTWFPWRFFRLVRVYVFVDVYPDALLCISS